MIFAAIGFYVLFVASNTFEDQATKLLDSHPDYETCDKAGKEWQKKQSGEHPAYFCKLYWHD
jgi:hypothetical protein